MMKNLYPKIIMMSLILLFIGTLKNNIIAQSICTECQECNEGEGETGEGGEGTVEDSTEFSADIGGESGEMSISETELLGSEAGEGVGEAVGEVSSEVVEATTTSLASSFLDAFSGIGIVAAAASFTSLALSAILAPYEEQQVKELFNTFAGGTYNSPLVPSFQISAEDLNASRDTVSYMFFIKKNLDANTLRTYLEQRGETSKIDKSYPLEQMTNNPQYAFSTFTGQTEGPGIAYDNSKMDIIHKSSIPQIELHVENGVAKARYTAHWSHNNEYRLVENDKSSTCVQDCYQLVTSIVNTSYSKTVDSPISFYAAIPTDEGLANVLPIPDSYIHYEELEDRIAVRIKDYDISRIFTDWDYTAINNRRYITMRIEVPENYITLSNGNKAFPENWDIQNPSSNFIWRRTWAPTKSWHDEQSWFTLARAPYTFELYPNTLNLHPNNKLQELFYFQIKDYQSRDTEQTKAAKLISNNYSGINLFPTLHSSGRTQYANTTVAPPDFGKSNLLIDIPFDINIENAEKGIEYIELQDLTNNVNVVLHHYVPTGSPYYQLGSLYDTKTSTSNTIENQAVEPGIDGALPRLTDSNELESGNNNRWLLQNTPLRAGDIVAITAHYKDGSLSRKTVEIPVANNIQPRAYYRLKTASNTYLNANTTTHEVSLGSSDSSQWLIEYQEGGAYAIMERSSKKILGIVDGTVALYPWDPKNMGLYWHLEPSTNDSVKLINIGQEAFLSGETSIGFSFTDGLALMLEHQAEAESLLPLESTVLVNRATQDVIDASGHLATLAPTNIFAEDSGQGLELHYIGCEHYAIYKEDIKSYLYANGRNELEWSTTEETPWAITNIDDQYFALTHQDWVVREHKLGNPNLVLVDIDDFQATPQHHGFHFSLESAAAPALLAHYAFEDNAEDGATYKHHGTAHNGLTYVEDLHRGTVANFDGVDDYIDTNYTGFVPDLYGGDLSVSLWMKTEDWGGANAKLIEGGAFSLIRQPATNTIRATMRNGQTVYHVDGDDVADNRWHHIVMVIDDDAGYTTLKLYIDGVLASERPESDILLNSALSPTEIGKSGQYKGLLDDVKLWRKALTPEEIASEYDKTIADDDLLAHYAFEGNVSSDNSVYRRHATYSNPPTLDQLTDYSSVAAKFDGTDDYLEVPYDFNPENHKGNVSASLWMRTETWGDANATLVESSTFSLRRDGSGNDLRADFRTSDTEGDFVNSSGVADNQWHHVVLVIRTDIVDVPSNIVDRKLQLYIDGALASETSVNSSFNTAVANTFIGRRQLEDNGYYNGYLDDLKIWKKALSAEEISNEYQATQRENLALHKPSLQSSTVEAKTANLAVDGDLSSFSPSKTAHESEPWWQVDLGGQAHINEVWISTPTPLSNYSIFISETPFTSNTLQGLRAQAGIHEFETLSGNNAKTNGVTGRYVRIQYSGTAALEFYEVQVAGTFLETPATNLALNKTVTQSSVANGRVPERAVDGNVDGSFSGNSISQTTEELEPWLEVDLGQRAYIEDIRVFNTTDDCCDWPFAGYHIFVSDVPFTSATVAGIGAQPGVNAFFRSEEAGNPTTIPVGKTGRYVRVQFEALVSLPRSMSIAELQVFGRYIVGTGPYENLALGKSATQSTTAHGGVPERAVDGNTNGNWAANSVTHTENEYEPWLEVDLGQRAQIEDIRVFNRTDCCADRFTDYHIFVSDAPFTSLTVAGSQGQTGVSDFHENGQADRPTTTPVNRTGRYIRVQLHNNGSQRSLNMAEIQAFGRFIVEPEPLENLALNKPATQSTTAWEGTPERAVDGNVDGAWPAASVTHTAIETQPWWQVDLGKQAVIDHIDIYNRTDCCSGRLTDYHIFVSENEFEGSTVAEMQAQAGVNDFYESGTAGSPTQRTIGLKGRYVRIQLASSNEALSLAEVGVFGTFTDSFDNLALDKPATQSFTIPGKDATLAVDGNVDGDYGHNSVSGAIANLEETWWEVDLGQQAQIEYINVYGRTDGNTDWLSNYHIFVSDIPFTGNSLASIQAQDGVGDFHESGVAGRPTQRTIGRTGRYVRIQTATANDDLFLAEVEVYGAFIGGGNSGGGTALKAVEPSLEKNDSIFEELVIYPNASDGNFNIGFSLSEAAEVHYRIVNPSGQSLKAESRGFPKGSNVWEVYADHLSNGIYAIEVVSKQWKEVRQIVITK